MVKKIILVVAAVVVIAALSWYFMRTDTVNRLNGEKTAETAGDMTSTSEEPAEQAPVIGMANPASTNCIDKGGTIEMRENKAGQYGVCLFEDNRQCEEWALFRGECPEGGLKITGYENDAQIYCAITGGKVEGVGTETPMCKRIDGTLCTVQANFDQECPDPHDPNPSAGNVEAP